MRTRSSLYIIFQVVKAQPQIESPAECPSRFEITRLYTQTCGENPAPYFPDADKSQGHFKALLRVWAAEESIYPKITRLWRCRSVLRLGEDMNFGTFQKTF